MTPSVTLSRHLKLETVEIEASASVDGQGKPTYLSPVDVLARVLRQDKAVIDRDGSQLRTVLALWIPADAALLPKENYRVTWEDEKFIVATIKDVKDRNAQLVHRRVRCRRE